VRAIEDAENASFRAACAVAGWRNCHRRDAMGGRDARHHVLAASTSQPFADGAGRAEGRILRILDARTARSWACSATDLAETRLRRMNRA